MYRLHYGIQNYEWGRKGKDSTILKCLQKVSGKNENDETKPYAEIWMGDHPNKPSQIELENGEIISLIDFIKKDPQIALGAVFDKYKEEKLPFLFKVLNVAKSLSIQAHPDKKLAEKLNKSFPEIYKDPNHKPEMALALTDFQALCNFVPLNDIKECFKEYTSYSNILDKKTIENFFSSESESEAKPYLKQIIKNLFDLHEEVIKKAIEEILSTIQHKENKTKKDELILTLQKEYPYDIGILFALLLNYITLKPGEALALEANEPHAYLFGDCMECKNINDICNIIDN